MGYETATQTDALFSCEFCGGKIIPSSEVYKRKGMAPVHGPCYRDSIEAKASGKPLPSKAQGQGQGQQEGEKQDMEIMTHGKVWNEQKGNHTFHRLDCGHYKKAGNHMKSEAKLEQAKTHDKFCKVCDADEDAKRQGQGQGNGQGQGQGNGQDNNHQHAEYLLVETYKVDQKNRTDKIAASIKDALDSHTHPMPADFEEKVAAVVETFVKPEVTIIVQGREDKDPQKLPKLHHHILPTVIKALSAGEHVYMVGPAGTGKSTIAKQAADALGLEFGAISLGPTTPTSKLFGYMTADGHCIGTIFKTIYTQGGLFCYDEIDNGHPGLVAEMNQCLSNGYGAFPDGVYPIHDTSLMVATANTHGNGATRQFIGRNQLDKATLDRFTEIEVPIDTALEAGLVKGILHDRKLDAAEWLRTVRKYRKAVNDLGLVDPIITPRAAISGAKLLSVGFNFDEALAMRLWKGTEPAVRAKIEAAAK